MQCMRAVFSSVLLHFKMALRLMVMSTLQGSLIALPELRQYNRQYVITEGIQYYLILCSVVPEGLPYLLMTLISSIYLLKHHLFHLHLRIVNGVIQSSTFPKRSTSASLLISYTSHTNQCTFWSSSVSRFRILFLKQSFHFQAINNQCCSGA